MAHNVALFITCLTDQFYPQVGIAVTKVLERFGCNVCFPAAQTCCGQPFFNNGFPEQAKELAKRFIEIFESPSYNYIVTPSGSCCAMVREQFHELFKGDHAWEAGVERVVSRTYEFVEFLDKVLKVDFSELSLPARERFTYHYTCHLRGIGVKDQAVKLLRQIGNVEFAPMEKTDQCCGFGGTFAVKYPAISGAIVDDKVKCIAEALGIGARGEGREEGARGEGQGASEDEAAASPPLAPRPSPLAPSVICNDAGCTMNISGMCHRQGVNTRVRHIAEVIAQAMGIDCTKW